MRKLALFLCVLFLISGSRLLAQEAPTPYPTRTPNWINPPSVPVRGPIVHRVPGQPGPTPGMATSVEHLIGITIDGYPFMMKPGPCAFSVEAAIQAHDDLLTGDDACDQQIRAARQIQRQKEVEDPEYANGPRITP